jgi:hypothetical protein
MCSDVVDLVGRKSRPSEVGCACRFEFPFYNFLKWPVVAEYTVGHPSGSFSFNYRGGALLKSAKPAGCN